MAKKKSNIEEFSEIDAREGREALLAIARNPDTKPKDKVEAWKLLMRMHKRLAPDKTIVKEKPKEKEPDPPLSESVKADLEKKYGL